MAIFFVSPSLPETPLSDTDSISSLLRTNLLTVTSPVMVVWHANLNSSVVCAFSLRAISFSVSGEQFSIPSRMSSLQVVHFPSPPHAFTWGISFLVAV